MLLGFRIFFDFHVCDVELLAADACGMGMPALWASGHGIGCRKLVRAGETTLHTRAELNSKRQRIELRVLDKTLEAKRQRFRINAGNFTDPDPNLREAGAGVALRFRGNPVKYGRCYAEFVHC